MTSLEDYQFLQSLKGKRLKLKSNDETFIGVVQRILNKTVILEDVKAVKSGRQHAVRHFHGREILGVEFLRRTEHKNGNNVESTTGEGHLTIAEYQPYKLDILQDKDDDEYVNYVVVNEFHQKFLPAIMEIKQQKVIGVGADGIGGLYLERLCWLQIATKNRVFLFDILALGALAFKNGLRKILANDRILKVVHDCRRLAACLIVLYGVKLMNVFDTQVADFLHFYRQTGGLLPDRVSTMQEVVSLHLGMPASHLSSMNIKSQLSKEDREVWYMRPCPDPLLKLMALSVIHLLPLRLVLLDALMSDYTSLVDSYLASVLYQPVQTQDIGQDSGLELSRELLEVEQLQQERQAWAMDYYPSTREGRLVRFMPRSNFSTSTEAVSVSSSHSHTFHDDTVSPAPAGPTEAPHDLISPSGSPTPTSTPYTTPLSHTPTSDTPTPYESTRSTPTPDTLTVDTSTSHTPTPHTPVPHTPSSHTPAAHIPISHIPTPHTTPGTPVPPTPSSHMPTTYVPSAHTPTLHTLTGNAPTPHTPTTYTPTFHTFTAHTPTPHIPPTHTPTALAPNGCAPAPYRPEVPVLSPNPLLTLPTYEATPSPPANQSQGSESPALPQSILTMKPRVLSTGVSKRSAPFPKVPKMDALPKQWPQTFPTESSASLSSLPPCLLEVITDTMGQSNPTTAAEGAGQSGISSYFNLDRGLQPQRAALSTQAQHTGTAPPSPTTKVAGSKGSASSSALESDVSLRPMAAMAGVAQKIGDGKPSTTSSPRKSTPPPVGSDKPTTAPPLGKETVLQKGPVCPSALSLAFSTFRMAS